MKYQLTISANTLSELSVQTDAGKYLSLLVEWEQFLRDRRKYEESEAEREVWAKVSDEWYAMKNDVGVSFD